MKGSESILNNIEGASIGALSSYITAELVNALGLNGELGAIANSLGGAALTQVVNNIYNLAQGAKFAADGSKLTAFSNVGPAVVNAAASYLGTKLANAIWAPETVGGQIGSVVGAAYGSYVAANILLVGGLNPVTFVAAVAAVAFWQLVGGLIGSIFGGTPRSGADSQWDALQRKFVVANVYSKKGGSKDAARNLAGTVSENFNSVLAATGGALLNPLTVQSGNYGMRKKDYVYRSYSTQDKEAITARFTGTSAAQNIIDHGTYLGLSSIIGQLAGGDIYVKRALVTSLINAGGNPNSNAAGASGQFNMSNLLGDLSTALDYGNYLKNSAAINMLLGSASNTSFSAGWLITLSRATELGLNKRSYTDWIGGYITFLDEALDGEIDGETLAASQLQLGFDTSTNSRYWAAYDQDDHLLGLIEDTIEKGSGTKIAATAAADTIDLRAGKLANQIGYTVDGHLNNDIAVSGADFTAKTASVSFAANTRRATVAVTVANDGVAEATESFLASLANAPTMRIMGGDAVATIVDGTAALPTLIVGDSYAWEDDGYAVFRLSLSKAATTAMTVSLALGDGRASGAGVDYGSTGATNLQVSSDGVTWTNATSVTFAVRRHEELEWFLDRQGGP